MLFLILFCGLAYQLHARGTSEEGTPVNGAANWEYTYDISDQQPGKYNILIEGRDKAGNLQTAGPFNVWVDPASDVPHVTIGNPTSDMRVGGNLNIVGTCVDDDATDHVEISLDDTQVGQVSGQEYWSFYLETELLGEGAHTVTVVGYDVNGTASEPVSVKFNLDRNKPRIETNSPGESALVSGTAQLVGTVTDGNGVESLEVSFDNGETFEPVKLDSARTGTEAAFKVSVDTREYKDGPAVVWLRSSDGQRSINVSALLLIVDNTPSALEILHPAADEGVNGVVQVVGTANDLVGLESLTCEYADQSYEIPISAGDPYFVQTLDFSAEDGKEASVRFVAIDRAGNRTDVQKRFPIDRAADKPVVTLDEPVPDASVTGTLRLSGTVADDDAPAALLYSLDGGEPVRTPTWGAFDIELSDVAPGKHRLEIWGVDSGNVESERQTVNVTLWGPPPVISFETVNAPVPERAASLAELFQRAGTAYEAGSTGTVDFAPGYRIFREAENVVTVAVTSFNTPLAAEVSIGEGEFRRVSGKEGDAGQSQYQIPVPSEVAYGVLPISVRVTDAGGNSAEKSTILAVVDTSRGYQDLYDGEAGTSGRGTFVSAAGPDGDAVFSPGMTLAVSSGVTLIASIPGNASYRGLTATVGGVSLRPRQSVRENGTVQVELPLPPSLPYGQTSVSLSWTAPTGTQETLSSEIIVVADARGSSTAGPAGVVGEPERIATGELTSFSPENPLYFYVDGKPVTSAELDPAVEGIRVSRNGNRIALVPETPVAAQNIVLRVIDSDGKQSTSRVFSPTFDPQPPHIRMAAPDEGSLFASSLVFSGSAGDDLELKDLSYRLVSGISSPGEGGFELIELDKESGSFTKELDLAPFPDGIISLYVRASDVSGQTTTVVRRFTKDATAPLLQQLTPATAAQVNGLVTFTGQVTDASGVAEITAGSGEEQPLQIPVSGVTQTGIFSFTLDLTRLADVRESYSIHVTDAAGNAATIQPTVTLDLPSDLPVVSIQTPVPDDVMRSDFSVTGMAYDDDEVSDLYFRIDEGAYAIPDGEPALADQEALSGYSRIAGGNGFSLPVSFMDLGDNEHTVEVIASDIYGVLSEPARRTIKISTAEPVAVLSTPLPEEAQAGVLTLSGTSSDANGIEEVLVSFDNGASFNLADGTQEWNYRLDSTALSDGVHPVVIKSVDSYATEGLFTSVITIDNTAPAVTLDEPADGTRLADRITLSGRLDDAGGIASTRVLLTPADYPVDGRTDELSVDVPVKTVLQQDVELGELPAGWYSLRLECEDTAGNVTVVARNIRVTSREETERVDILYPYAGESANSSLPVGGRLVSRVEPSAATLLVDGETAGELEFNKFGYFNSRLGPETLTDGKHELAVRVALADGTELTSVPVPVTFSRYGPWVLLSNFNTGDVLTDRPYVEGTAGYALPEVPADDPGYKEYQKELKSKSVESVEVSLDGGRTYQSAKGAEEWRYRVETQEHTDGPLFATVRARFTDGATAVRHVMYTIDKTPPEITVLSPNEGGRFNDTIDLMGTASDNVALEEVRVLLRKGDKAGYEIPSFIQGLYLDGHGFGANTFEVGAGLTFFDNNVKLQANVGHAPGGRFEGTTFGIKLIANVFYLPWSYLLGPDFDFLSSSVGVGAQFVYFSMDPSSFSFSSKGTMLGSAFLQLELAHFTFQDMSAFSSYGLYTEGQFWFISSDVLPEAVFKLAFGLRVSVF